MKSRSRSLRTGAAAIAVAALALAGCSAEEPKDAGAGTGGLKGDPIKLGSILTITNPAWSNASVKTVNEAWASHINTDLGGIGGRPVVVESCDDHGDPAKTSQCLNNLMDSGVVSLVNDSSLAFGANALPAAEKAGLANIGGWPVSPDEYTSKVNFPTTPGAVGSYPAIAVHFAATGSKKLAVAYTNTPSGQQVGEALKKLWTELGGADYFMTEFDPTATDFTPTLTKIAAEKPDAVILAVGEGPAPRMLQAAKIAGLTAKIGVSATPATKKVFDAAGEAANGLYIAFASVPSDYDSADAKTYRDVLAKSSPGLELTNQTAVAASSMQYAYDILSSIKGDITKESVLKKLQENTPWKGFLTHPTDPAHAPESMPQISNPYNLVSQYKDGKFTPAPIDDPGNLADHIDVVGELTWIAGTPPKR
ncbi:ABC transporter substrate-binding protein [Sphaerisporangium viridialbum]|uniref:ABC transporter substrate-binding protein n=1 Tax=Sphaerisporangium viridialbum TaxID=46189 RepID=UPI003C77B6CD